MIHEEVEIPILQVLSVLAFLIGVLGRTPTELDRSELAGLAVILEDLRQQIAHVKDLLGASS